MNVINLASDLVKIPGVNPNSMAKPDNTCGEKGMTDYLEKTFRDMGANIVIKEPFPNRRNVFAYFDLGGSEVLLFDVHTDTVPVTGMVIDPFSGEVHSEKLWGRGSSDVKGPMAAMIAAIYQAQITKSARYNVLFAAVCDEEAGFGGVKHFAANYDSILAELGILNTPPVCAIVAEPTNFCPVIGHKGAVRWIVKTEGIAAHSSNPQNGVNAIYKMARVVTKLEDYAKYLADTEPHPYFNKPALSVGLITGGSAANIVPDYCEIEVDRRLIPGETPEGATESLRDILSDTQAIISEPTISAAVMHTDEKNPFVQRVLKISKKIRNEVEPVYAGYCTDASFYSGLNIPVVVYGPGSIAQAHTKDEWISTADLNDGVDAYYNILTCKLNNV